MRITLTLDDDVIRLARRRATDLDRPLKDVINDALRDGLTRATRSAATAACAR